QYLANGVIGGADVSGDVDVRDIERVRDLVEAERLAVFGELPLQLKPGRMQQVAQGVFVFVGIQASLGDAPYRGGQLGLCRVQRRRQSSQDCFEFRRIR